MPWRNVEILLARNVALITFLQALRVLLPRVEHRRGISILGRVLLRPSQLFRFPRTNVLVVVFVFHLLSLRKMES